MKKLFIHAGGAKTGTSALQNCFERNADLLRAHGIDYQNALNIEDSYVITSGNGIPLYHALTSESNDAAVGEILTSYLAERLTGICSSEALQFLTHAHWGRIVEIGARVNIDIHIIFFVRNVEPCLSSQYDQLIKRHGEFREYMAYLLYAEWDHFRCLKEIAELNPAPEITVLHYDTHRERLLESFLNVIQPGKNLVASFPSMNHVNRSLSEPERAVMRLANLISNDRFSQELSDILLRADTEARYQPPLARAASRLLKERFARKISWINKVYFAGKPVVSIGNRNLGREKTKAPPEQAFSENFTFIGRLPKYKGLFKRGWAIIRGIAKSRTPHDVAALQAYQTALKWSIQRLLRHDQDRTIRRLRLSATKHKSIDLKNEFPTFDPIEYLLLNQDVLESNLDPTEHYVQYGLKEGRPVRFSE